MAGLGLARLGLARHGVEWQGEGFMTNNTGEMKNERVPNNADRQDAAVDAPR